MEEIAHLIIRVSSDKVDEAQKKLRNLGLESRKTEEGVGSLFSASGKLMGMFAAVTAAAGTAALGIKKLYDVGSQFESLRAQLKTATGSAQNAATAFEAIQAFATQTPYDLAQSTEAFIKLVNLGLTPSERALRSYGNTASAMGKDLSTMVQAVANATVGEFEVLKQFGIKARTESDGIAFTFRGSTTKVKNDARSIEEYFIKLGENNFASSMAERMKTLQGATSNLSDAWDVLFDTISQAGAGELMKDSILLATDAIQELTALIGSGQLAGYIDAVLFKFDNLLDGVHNAVSNVTDFLSMVFHYWATDGKGAVDFIVDAFINLPENVRAVVQGIGATMGLLVEYGIAVGKGIYSAVTGYFHLLFEIAKNLGNELLDQIKHPFSEGKFDFLNRQTVAVADFGIQVGQAWNTASESIGRTNDAWGETITGIMNERDASLKAFDDKIKAANKLRQNYDDLKKSKESADGKTDRLAKFKVGGNDKQISEQQRHQLESLRASLDLEEVTISESYKRRLQIIQAGTVDGSALQIQLEQELNKRVTIEYEKAFADRANRVLGLEANLRDARASGQLSQVESLTLQLQNEEEQIKASYERRKQQILDDTSLTEEERQKRISNLEGKYVEIHRERERARNAATLQTTADFFGNISKIAAAFGSKGAKIAKAAAIAQATVKTYESATSAYASLAGIPYVGPALGTAAAGAAIVAGLANVAAIRATDYSGAFDTGGMIPAGKWGWTNELGPEKVSGPAVVTSRRNTADRYGDQSGNETKVFVTVNNHTDSEVSVTERNTQQGKFIDMVVKRTKGELTREVHTGGTPFAKAFETNYGVRRGKK